MSLAYRRYDVARQGRFDVHNTKPMALSIDHTALSNKNDSVTSLDRKIPQGADLQSLWFELISVNNMCEINVFPVDLKSV